MYLPICMYLYTRCPRVSRNKSKIPFITIIIIIVIKGLARTHTYVRKLRQYGINLVCVCVLRIVKTGHLWLQRLYDRRADTIGNYGTPSTAYDIRRPPDLL